MTEYTQVRPRMRPAVSSKSSTHVCVSLCVCVSGCAGYSRLGWWRRRAAAAVLPQAIHQVIGQLGDQVHRVDDEDGVVAVVDKVQNVLVGMSVK